MEEVECSSEDDAAIRAFRNVNVIEKHDPIAYMGACNNASILHVAAIF